MSMQSVVRFFSAVAICGLTLETVGCSTSSGLPPDTDVEAGMSSAPLDSGQRDTAYPGVADSGRESREPRQDSSTPTDAAKEVAPLACPPADTKGFTPPAYVPAVGHKGLCTTDAITAFVTACGRTPDCQEPECPPAASDAGAACADWKEKNVEGAVDGGAGTACGNCIFAPGDNGAVWVDPAGVANANYAACIQLTDTVHGTVCATAYNADNACYTAACEACATPNADAGQLGVTDLVQCWSAADCEATDTQENSACAIDFVLDGGAFFTCSPASGGPEDWTLIATLICGGSAQDGGGATDSSDAHGD
jgi:hypothetical protein